MATTVLLTGFPGFLARSLLVRHYKRYGGESTISCLVEPHRMDGAEALLQVLEETTPGLSDRVRLYEGDITDPELGLSTGRLNFLKGAVTDIFHLAAIYDLEVEAPAARQVNVLGTRHMLNLAGKCSKLRRFHHVSTCYVSGRHDGPFREQDLDLGQRFHNHYEASKFHAEAMVRDAMANGLPGTIYRPSIVVGDSKTGETNKYDGLYHVLQWILRLPKRFVFPDFGTMDRTEVNIVPRDFVVAAIDALSARDDSEGKTYHLADPQPPTVRELLGFIEQATGQSLVPVRVPKKVTARLVAGLPGLSHWVRIPLASFAYFTHPTRYDSSRSAEELSAIGIAPPRVSDYLHRLMEYMLEHPEAR